jgi:peroxiredoxin
MPPLRPGAKAPTIRGVSFAWRPALVWFYKVTCPVCQMSAPAISKFHQSYTERIFGVGQDPEPKLKEFSKSWGLDFPSVHDLDPYPASTAYGVETVPTLFLIHPDRTIDDFVEGWDREGVNRISRRFAMLAGEEYAQISSDGDGLPAFRPG